MTTIILSHRIPTQLGVDAQPRMTIDWVPTKRLIEDDSVIHDKAFTVDIQPRTVGSIEVVDVRPTGVDWAWKVTEKVSGAKQYTERFFLVPETDELVQYTSLVEVDPTTLNPVGPAPVDAWRAALEETAATVIVQVEFLADDAADSAEEAELAAQTAITNRNQAMTARADALAYRDAALGARDISVLRAGDAAASAGNAATSAGQAGSSAGLANEAVIAAEAYRDGAQNGASVALQNRNEAEGFRNQASDSATAAAGSATAAGTSATASGTARDAAVAARNETLVSPSSTSNISGAVTLAASTTRSALLNRTLTGNVTLTVSSGTAGTVYSCTLALLQDATGGRTLTFAGTNVRTVGGLPLVLTGTPGSLDFIHMLWTGSYWIATMGMQDVKAIA